MAELKTNSLSQAENIEMRNHFNSMIKQLNEITAFVNQKYGAEFDHGTTPYGFDEIDRVLPLLLLIPPVVHSPRSITSGLT